MGDDLKIPLHFVKKVTQKECISVNISILNKNNCRLMGSFIVREEDHKNNAP